MESQRENFRNVDLLKDGDAAKLREKRRGLYARRK